MLNILDSASPILSKEVHVLCPLKHGLEKGLNSPSPAVVSARFLSIGTRVPKRQSFQTAVGPLTLQDIGHVLPRSPHPRGSSEQADLCELTGFIDDFIKIVRNYTQVAGHFC